MPDWPAAVFLDRDGVVMPETGAYIVRIHEVQLLPGAAEAIRRLNDNAIPAIVVTNQAGVARGALTSTMLAAIHLELTRRLDEAGARLDAIYACEHQDGDDCTCRKPLPGMLVCGAEKAGVRLNNCLMIGDSPRDIAAGAAVGCTTVLIGPSDGAANDCTPAPDHVFTSLYEAVKALVTDSSEARL
ncbi:MAG: HAD family hydrolase [Armatimonadetes bacterium]|nr:HAD family hydrolase [Armatimonadota bacterium]MDE2206012.1 HAD family hydrolase [Armatimonadota bacterium]